ncbi:MAG TPA: hypothetical protein VGO67_15030 [Verrucomicrobiae bacterium]|jgi:hypothetical protein
MKTKIEAADLEKAKGGDNVSGNSRQSILASGAYQVRPSSLASSNGREEAPKFDGTSWPEGWFEAHLARQASQPMAMSQTFENAVAGCSQPKSRNWLVAGMLAALLLGALVSRALTY